MTDASPARLPVFPILSLVCGLGSMLLLAGVYLNRQRLAGEPGDDTYVLALLGVPAVAFVGFVLALVAWRLGATPRWLGWLALAVNVVWAVALIGFIGAALGSLATP